MFNFAVGLEFRLGWGCVLLRPMQYAECSKICNLSHEPHLAGDAATAENTSGIFVSCFVE